MAKKHVDVAIALVWRAGQLLVSRRPEGVHLAGSWEFPGGKMEPGESAARSAERELEEEVKIRACARRERDTIEYEYADRVVRLHPVDCEWIAGEPQAEQVAEVRWCAPADLHALDFPPANAPLLAELAREAAATSA